MASSDIMLWRNLRYDDLKRLKRAPRNATSAWLGSEYREAPRSLSMDACAWTRWDIPVTPWTTWKASWNDQALRFAPLTDTFPVPVRRAWRDRLLGKFKRRTCMPTSVCAFRQNRPSKRPRSPELKKRPTPFQGGFIEHLDENRRFRDMLSRKHGQGVWHRNKSSDAGEAETWVKWRRFPTPACKTEVSLDEQEGDKHDVPTQRRKQRSIAWAKVKRRISSLV
ncbi:hypothetical protein SVAN01_09477 [Stagonosporopsis vannaccii]|nr:hypothetical protein SVAN01_09477 [Stagonosporopsis vannaccii]